MSNISQLLDHIKECIDSGVYAMIRLVRVDGNGKFTPVIPFSKVINRNTATDKYNQIVAYINTSIQPGNYAIECKTTRTVNAAIPSDMFEFTVNDKLQILPVNNPRAQMSAASRASNVKVSQKPSEEMGVDVQEHIAVVVENERLRAQVSMQMIEIQALQEALFKKTGGEMGDPAPATLADKAIAAIGENIPAIVGVFDKMLDLQDKKMNIQAQKLLNDRGGSGANQEQQRFMSLMEHFNSIPMDDHETFDTDMDELEQEDPNMYYRIAMALGVHPSQHPEDQGGEGDDNV